MAWDCVGWFFGVVVAFAFPLNAPPVVTSGGNGSKEKGLNLRQDGLKRSAHLSTNGISPLPGFLSLPISIGGGIGANLRGIRLRLLDEPH